MGSMAYDRVYVESDGWGERDKVSAEEVDERVYGDKKFFVNHERLLKMFYTTVSGYTIKNINKNMYVNYSNADSSLNQYWFLKKLVTTKI